MATVRASVPVSAVLPYQVNEEEGWFKARCELLKVTTAARSEGAAIEYLKDSISLLLQGAIEDRNLEQLLLDCGLTQTRKAGVGVWEAPPEVKERFKRDRELEMVVTLHPLMPAGEPEGYQLDPVVISVTAKAHADRVSH